MPSYLTNYVIKEVRNRKTLTRKAIQDNMSYKGLEEDKIISELTIMRAEKEKQSLQPDNFSKLMDTMEMPVDAYFCASMENLTSSQLRQYSTLSHYVTYAKEDGDIYNKATALLNKLKADPAFFGGISKQRLISQEVALLEAAGEDPIKIRNLIIKGLQITYPEFEEASYIGDMLVFDEGLLLHNLVRTHMREGNINQSIALLTKIIGGLTHVPQDDKDKERLLAPLLLTLAQIHMQENNYADAYQACESGHKLTIKRNNGLYAPDFVELKAYCLHKQGKTDQLPSLILQALAGYLLLRRYNKADNLLQYARNHNIKIETHGMETVRPPMPEPIFAFGDIVNTDNIGQFIASIRHNSGLTLEELCDGLCTKSTLHKLESNRLPLDKVYLLEALMQRLGKHIDHYFDTFPTIEEFRNKQIRDEVNALLILLDYDAADKLLDQLAMKKSFKSGINLQFVESARASIYANKMGRNKELAVMLENALNITRKKKPFDIGQVASTRLAYKEVTAVNQLAICLCSIGEMRKGLCLFEDLIENMDKFYVDEHEKIRMFSAVQYNYSYYLGHAERYKESIDVAIKGSEMDAKHQRLRLLPEFALNIAVCMHRTDENEKCLPYFTLAFYGSMVAERHDNAKIIQDYVIKQFNINYN